ncbi:hypothetical protein SAMN05660662_0089 [Blastococcus aurantiacus]|uniref:Uncharacterized protein n=1 Tax=Blastococcus aurantiacus TaxID=1550231 RepID=A0A1G7QZA7_9ACTN|nr:hypothetical protein SAMN05660662_0089 [Blastococcus aurantiacus]
MTPPPDPLHVSGELSREVDGAGVQVHADGSDVRIVAEDAGAVVARVREAATARSGVAPGRRDLGGLAEALSEAGITAHRPRPRARWPWPAPASTRRPVAACSWAPGWSGPAPLSW